MGVYLWESGDSRKRVVNYWSMIRYQPDNVKNLTVNPTKTERV